MDPDYVEAVRAHVERFWPGTRAGVLRPDWDDWWQRANPGFRVVERPPVADDDAWLYVSAGIAWVRQDEGVGHEYLVLSPREDPGIAQLLTMIGAYAEREDGALHDGHTVPIGEPWTEGAEADHLYVSKPYLVSHEFELLRYADDLGVHFLWLVPVTGAEVRWRHAHGQEAFEQLFEDRGLVPDDPERASLV